MLDTSHTKSVEGLSVVIYSALNWCWTFELCLFASKASFLSAAHDWWTIYSTGFVERFIVLSSRAFSRVQHPSRVLEGDFKKVLKMLTNELFTTHHCSFTQLDHKEGFIWFYKSQNTSFTNMNAGEPPRWSIPNFWKSCFCNVQMWGQRSSTSGHLSSFSWQKNPM